MLTHYATQTREGSKQLARVSPHKPRCNVSNAVVSRLAVQTHVFMCVKFVHYVGNRE